MIHGRILLANDDPQIRLYLRSVLSARDYIADEASHGIEALDVLKASGGAVDLLVTDIRMPAALCDAAA